MGEPSDADSRMRQAQKLEAIGRLAAGVAHDFNNVLTALLGSVEAFQRDPSAHDPATFAADVGSIVQRAMDLTRPLVQLARQEHDVAASPFDLNAIVEAMAAMLTRVVGGDVRIDVELDPEIGNVIADRCRIQQAILNLVVNARDAMPDGGTITVRSKAVALAPRDCDAHLGIAPGSWALLSVADRGSGIEASALPSVFDPFFTTKPDGTGTGLGLTIVRAAVEHAGGRVGVTSALGVGSTFTLYLPRA